MIDRFYKIYRIRGRRIESHISYSSFVGKLSAAVKETKMRIVLLQIIALWLISLVGKSSCQLADAGTVTAVADGDVEDLDATAETESSSDKGGDGEDEPVQSGPLIDLLGTKLQSLEINTEEQTAQVKEHFTNEALSGKKVIGLYFSADWCGPCRQFTPELVSFYDRMNKRRGQKDQFQIVMISRCRDMDSHYQYFSLMPWLAMPLEEASGQRGQDLGEKYGVKGIPSLVLIDDLGQTITTDARNKIPADKVGIGFPWRDPLSQLYNALVPRSLRMMVKLQIDGVKTKIVGKIKNAVRFGKK